MTTDLDPFDLDAAILRKNEQDMRAFLSALANRLDGALPGRVLIERKRDSLFASTTHVVKISLTIEDASYAIALDRVGVRTTRAKVVRGVILSTTPVAAGVWMDEVRKAVARLSESSDEASSVIAKFL